MMKYTFFLKKKASQNDETESFLYSLHPILDMNKCLNILHMVNKKIKLLKAKPSMRKMSIL